MNESQRINTKFMLSMLGIFAVTIGIGIPLNISNQKKEDRIFKARIEKASSTTPIDLKADQCISILDGTSQKVIWGVICRNEEGNIEVTRRPKTFKSTSISSPINQDKSLTPSR